jgi:hypothetical protein
VKSEILRFFGGADKTLAEAAENFLKPIEERLGQSDALGHKWREERPHLGIVAWKNGDGTIELYVAGPHVDERFREELQEAVRHTTRQQSDNVKVIFPDQKKPGTGAK